MRALLLPLLILAGLCAAVSCCGPRQGVVVAAYSEPFDAEAFGVAVRALEAECPLNAPAAIGVRLIPEAVWGRTAWYPPAGLYLIEIEARQPFQAIIDTLIHEWAHAMVWDASEGPEYDSHGPLWGVAQARAYRVVLAALLALTAEREALEALDGVEPLAPLPAPQEVPEDAQDRAICGHR